MKLLFNGEVNESGRLKIFNRRKMMNELVMFAGKKVVITIEQKKKKRSLSQNAYLHAVVIPMCRQGLIDVGYKYSIKETKQDLKRMFAVKEKVNENTGEIREYIQDTSDMSTVEMLEFIADIQQWAAEYLSIVIPDPGQQIEIEY